MKIIYYRQRGWKISAFPGGDANISGTALRKSYFDSTNIEWKYKDIATFFSTDYFEADVDRSTCLHATSSRRVKHFVVSDMIYHKFSHGAVSYTLNGKNINIMLELAIILE